MKKTLTLLIFLCTAVSAKESIKKLPIIVCKIDTRSFRIDLSQKHDINSDFAYKAEFYLNKTYFGNCMLKIENEFMADKSQSALNQIIFSNSGCNFISEKQSKGLSIVKKGIINYNVKDVAFVDLFVNQQPMKCKFE